MSKKQRENFTNDEFISEITPLITDMDVISDKNLSKTLDKRKICDCKVVFYNKNSGIIAYEFNGVPIQTNIPNGDCIKNGYVTVDSESGRIV